MDDIMMERERQIASLFAITVGLTLLIVVPNLIPVDADQDDLELNIPQQFCEDVPLGNPGGLSFTMAMVCVNGEFEIATNTGHLTTEKYNEIIQPVLDSLHSEARKAGITTNEYER